VLQQLIRHAGLLGSGVASAGSARVASSLANDGIRRSIPVTARTGEASSRWLVISYRVAYSCARVGRGLPAPWNAWLGQAVRGCPLGPAGGSDWHSPGRLCMRGSPSALTEPAALQTMTAQRRVVWTWPAAFVPSIAG
jgi:hypothetical protein